ncbi:hypothetical protein ACFFLZ_23070 [Photobacterium aphoticum]|uniref:Uncharacterized protein n=1 Tax=Photobacterium aphoticum TaxID=754436 RepID=A0A0J1JL67_9GAMM|nr:hypothetical protein [Photobacterium aphoticum]KLV02802.1 hypothetical protein ABT58_01735 [Photobacterium aphoticum]PSU58131.1 hypothetical protein C9I90_07555 [Photobacterium aphoticum]GHA36182.1 hypothetical protein GCM10007086_06710 [Photobacterium aphoticum]
MVVKHLDSSGLAGHFAHDTPRKISMHEDVPVWCDVCVCEAEPYWQAIAQDQGEKSVKSETEE